MNQKELEAAYAAISYRTRPVALEHNLSYTEAEDLYWDCVAHFKCQLPHFKPELGTALSTFAGEVTDNYLNDWVDHRILTQQIFLPMTDEIISMALQRPCNNSRSRLRYRVYTTIKCLPEFSKKICDMYLDTDDAEHKPSFAPVRRALGIPRSTWTHLTLPRVKTEFKAGWKTTKEN